MHVVSLIALLLSTPDFQEKPVEVDCQPQHPDRCLAKMMEADRAPYPGILLSMPLAHAIDASIQETFVIVAEERDFCRKVLLQEERAREADVQRLLTRASRREKELQDEHRKEVEDQGVVTLLAVGIPALVIGAGIGAGVVVSLSFLK